MKALRKIGLSLGLVAALAGCSEPEYLPKLENYARNGQVRISRGYLLDVDGDKIVDALADIEHPDVAIYVNPDSVDKLKYVKFVDFILPETTNMIKVRNFIKVVLIAVIKYYMLMIYLLYI